jgi:hypothetical protein
MNTNNPVARCDRSSRFLSVVAIAVAALALAGCVGTAPQADTTVKVVGAFAGAAALWLDSLRASGAISPEQAAEFGTVVAQAQSTMDLVGAAARATAQAVGLLRAEVTTVRASSFTAEEMIGAGAATAATAAAIVHKIRGPSATTEERVKRAQQRKG